MANGISSDDGTTFIVCNPLGIGGAVIGSQGNWNYELGNLNNVGSLSTTADTLNITTPTTQIANGSGNVEITTQGTGRLLMQGNYTSLRAGTGMSDRLDIDGLGAYIAVQGNPVFYVNPSNNDTRIWSPDNSSVLGIENTNGIKINGSYYLPNTDGTQAGQVMTTNGAGVVSFQTQPTASLGIFSQTSSQTVGNTVSEQSLVGAGVGSVVFPPTYFSLGTSVRWQTGGVFRNNANNTVFRFRCRATPAGVLLDTGLLTLNNIATLTPWSLELNCTLVGSSSLVTSFTFQYSDGNQMRGFVRQNTLNTFNAAITQSFDITCQWSVTNTNNTITSTCCVISKMY